MIAVKLTTADHAMIHAVHVLGYMAWDRDPDHDEMVLSFLREALPRVSRDLAPLAGLIAAADRVLAHRGPVDGIRHELRAACHEWHRRRLALAWASLTGDAP